MVEDVWSWSAGFDAFVVGFAARFPRVESRRQMRCHVRGLLSEVERKNGWALAEATGQSGPERMQRLLNFYAWDEDGVRDDLRAMVTEVLGDPESGVLIVDETGFLKKGVKSAGVARQYSGTAGRVENSQIGVFLAYASDRGRALVDRELYLPREWTADRSRCREAGVGDEVGFATKQVLARRMLERAVDSGVPFAWVTADELYGMDTKFRLWMEGRDIAHVVAVPKSASVVTMWLTKERADGLIAAVPDENWQRLSCGDGVRGPKVSDWAVLDIRPLRDSGKGHWLLARRSL
ncbi:IS701 family transposase, partial [Actinosynnema sp. NPDC000082]